MIWLMHVTEPLELKPKWSSCEKRSLSFAPNWTKEEISRQQQFHLSLLMKLPAFGRKNL
jgi:hypothetical protein